MLKKMNLGGVSNLEVMPLQDPRRGGSSGICGCYFLISNNGFKLEGCSCFQRGMERCSPMLYDSYC